MCLCKNVSPGSYEVIIPVWYNDRKRVVGIDLCIVMEILDLWEKGIITIESCCGHNKTTGYIAVDEIFIPTMLKLGYKIDKRTETPGCFIPKNILKCRDTPEGN